MLWVLDMTPSVLNCVVDLWAKSRLKMLILHLIEYITYIHLPKEPCLTNLNKCYIRCINQT